MWISRPAPCPRLRDDGRRWRRRALRDSNGAVPGTASSPRVMKTIPLKQKARQRPRQAKSNSGGGIRTPDLKLMGLASYQAALLRDLQYRGIRLRAPKFLLSVLCGAVGL